MMNVRHTTTWMLLSCLMLSTIAAGTAQAGWFNRKKADRTRNALAPVHFDRQRPLDFTAGPLVVDGYGRYRVGNFSLEFDGASEKDRRNRRGGLRLGQEYRIAGHRQADGTLLVQTIEVVPVDPTTLSGSLAGGPKVGKLPASAPK